MCCSDYSSFYKDSITIPGGKLSMNIFFQTVLAIHSKDMPNMENNTIDIHTFVEYISFVNFFMGNCFR